MERSRGFAQGLVAVGVSVGGMEALPRLLAPLPRAFPWPLVVVQHVGPDTESGFMIEFLTSRIALDVDEARERERPQPGRVYLAPTNYHLLVERKGTFSLSVDAKVNHSRPSIDVLFESAAESWGPAAVGVVLTGASDDGARGLKRIQERGGLALVQDPETAESAIMPLAAIRACRVDLVAPLEGLARGLIKAAGFEEASEPCDGEGVEPLKRKNRRKEIDS